MLQFKLSFLALCMTLGFSLPSHSVQPTYETVTISGGFTVRDSEVQTVRLKNSRYIRNIVVQAQGARTDSMIEVMVNGEVKGTIYAPGRDPSYIVTVGETASSIQFRHRSGGAMQVQHVVATLSTWKGRPENPHGGGHSFHGTGRQIEDLANRTLVAIEMISRYSTLEEEQVYLMPIKKKAGQVLVMVDSRGEYSRKTVTNLLALREQINFSTEYINLMMEQDGLFDYAVELLSIAESIDDLLD